MNITWDAKEYQQNFHFVYNYGQDVLSLVDVPKNSFVIDFGCGNGELTSKLKAQGYQVLGVDASSDMIALAKQNHPDIEFKQANIIDFQNDAPADAIFSNAVLHWIDEDKQQTMLCNIASNLKQGGLFAFEFGGYGCGASVHDTLAKLFAKHGLVYKHPFYFPTIGMYAPKLEQAGFKVVYATLFDRFTPVKGENGIVDWIKMFDKAPFIGIDKHLAENIMFTAQEQLSEKLYKDKQWYVDYVRIRMKNIKL